MCFSYIATDAYKTSVVPYFAKLDQGYRLLRASLAIPTLVLIVPFRVCCVFAPSPRGTAFWPWARGKYPPMQGRAACLG